ncbi:tRNA-dihydrouridine synthase [Candidatus Saccharibacteria bacterium]|nr:MAG: tRNA-dihydrouridine synthase [Candidatus Saccharibacteria bacterium]
MWSAMTDRPLLVLAPMDDVTDSVFRQVVAACAPPDVFFTEFVNVDGLQSPGRPKLLKKLRFTPQESPLVAQLWGREPDNYRQTARQIADGTFARELGLPSDVNFAGIDINMGCPVKVVVNNGCGSGHIRDRAKAEAIIRAVQEGADGRLPVSVKTRVGFNTVDMSWIEWLLGQNLDVLTVHGRTRKQMSAVPADWELIGRARQLRDALKVNTLIIGNGDVASRKHGLALAARYGLDGVMIGRGIFSDPFVFAANSPWAQYDSQQKAALFRRHIELFAETWQGRERPVQTLNKFCKVYINDFDDAKHWREQLMQAQSTDELLATLNRLAA